MARQKSDYDEFTLSRARFDAGSYNNWRKAIFLDPTRHTEAHILYTSSAPLEIEPLQDARSTGFRGRHKPCVPPQYVQVPLRYIQNLHLHRLGSFEDFRLNLKAFPRLQKLVIYIMTDQTIRKANFDDMTDDEVYQFFDRYIWHAQRHRHFRDNLSRLYHLEGQRRTFSLKVRMSYGEGLGYILVDLDTWEIERGPGSQPLNFLQPEKERILKPSSSSTLPWGECRGNIQAYVQHMKSNTKGTS